MAPKRNGPNGGAAKKPNGPKADGSVNGGPIGKAARSGARKGGNGRANALDAPTPCSPCSTGGAKRGGRRKRADGRAGPAAEEPDSMACMGSNEPGGGVAAEEQDSVLEALEQALEDNVDGPVDLTLEEDDEPVDPDFDHRVMTQLFEEDSGEQLDTLPFEDSGVATVEEAERSPSPGDLGSGLGIPEARMGVRGKECSAERRTEGGVKAKSRKRRERSGGTGQDEGKARKGKKPTGNHTGGEGRTAGKKMPWEIYEDRYHRPDVEDGLDGVDVEMFV
jgi:hypothetical protein